MKTPLNYAILTCVWQDGPCDAEDVVARLAPRYGRHRAFRKPAVVEALMTAERNGILEETGARLSADGALLIQYRVTDYGAALMRRFLPQAGGRIG